MAGLDKLYKEPIKDEKLKNFPLPKLIEVLSGNDGHRRSLENMIKFGEKKFIDQVHHIVDNEVEKSSMSTESKLAAASFAVTIVCEFTPYCSQISSQIGKYSKLVTSTLFGSSK